MLCIPLTSAQQCWKVVFSHRRGQQKVLRIMWKPSWTRARRFYGCESWGKMSNDRLVLFCPVFSLHRCDYANLYLFLSNGFWFPASYCALSTHTQVETETSLTCRNCPNLRESQRLKVAVSWLTKATEWIPLNDWSFSCLLFRSLSYAERLNQRNTKINKKANFVRRWFCFRFP